MFEFFRDTILELQGIDSDKAKMERLLKEQKKNEKKKEKIIIPKTVKSGIQILSAFSIVSNISTLVIIINSKGTEMGMLIKLIPQLAVSIALFVLMFFKNKKTEIISIALIVLFVLIQYFGFYLLSFV